MDNMKMKDFLRLCDKVGQFMDDKLVIDATKELPTDAVYEAYQQWCSLEGLLAESQKKFKLNMEEHDIYVCRKRPADIRLGTNPRMMFIGIDWAPTPAYVLSGINGGNEP